MKAETDCK